MNRAAVLLLLGLAGCASSQATDGPGDPERRAKFLAGASAAEARELVATDNPAHIDAVASFFLNLQKPYPERLAALSALRTLRTQDPEEYARIFPRVRPKLWEEVAHSVGMDLSPQHEKAFIDAIGWLSDQKDPQARLTLELHLDRETVKRKRLPELAMCAAALALASYPESESARETLWAALRDPKEIASVRACCLKALKGFHPEDLEARIVKLPATPGDEWLRDLQNRLR